MTRPVVGIIGSHNMLSETHSVYFGSTMNARAVAEVAGAVPLIVPSDPELVSTEDLMAACDGFLFTGARANVHPSHYGHEETEAHGAFDHGRDAVTLPLLRAAVAAGQPCLAICRGFQELAVAFGSTLHPEIREIPGRMNHRMPPEGTLEEKFALRHDVTFAEDGPFARLLGKTVVRTNTLHGQGITDPGERVVIDGHASDGTPEAIYIEGAPGFALGVQWHAEYNAAGDPVSAAIFGAFAEALRKWKAGERPGRLKSA